MRARSSRTSMIALAMVALLAGAGCRHDSTDSSGGVTVDVGPGRDTIPGTIKVQIDYTVRNDGTAPVTLMHCEGFTMITVEKRTNGTWQAPSLYGCPDAPIQDLIVAPGETHAGGFPIAGAGTYRVKVWRKMDDPSADPFIISRGFVVR